MAGRTPTKVSGNYASGIAFPFAADGDGGVNLSEGDAYIRGLVYSAVQPNYSDNPYQDIGGTDFPVFQIAGDVGWRQTYKRRVTQVFALLERENLAKLVKVKFDSERTGLEEGTVRMFVQYVNLENAMDAEIAVGLEGQQSAGSAASIPGFLG